MDQQGSCSASPPTSGSGMGGDHSEQEERNPTTMRDRGPGQPVAEIGLAERSSKRARGADPCALSSGPSYASEAVFEWLMQNEHMFTLCNSLGENDVPILLTVCHDAVCLATLNTLDIQACNR